MKPLKTDASKAGLVIMGIVASGIVGCLGVWVQRCARRRCWRVSPPSPIPTAVENDNDSEPSGDLLSLGNSGASATTQAISPTPEQLALPCSDPMIALPAPEPFLALTNGPMTTPPPPSPLAAMPPQHDIPVALLYELQGKYPLANILIYVQLINNLNPKTEEGKRKNLLLNLKNILWIYIYIYIYIYI
jgi:hypothetical protein